MLSGLTCTCMQMQTTIESSETTEAEKREIILQHLKSSQTYRNTDPFPEFNPGWQWFNVKQALTVGQDLKGKITVVDFFTYCCINCMHILPDLHALEEKYTSEQHGVAVIGVHSAKFDNEKVSENISAALQRYSINHPVVNDSQAFFWTMLGIVCWPTLVILGPDTKPVFVIIGEGHRDLLFRYVESCLDFFRDEIVPRPLPVLLDTTGTFHSHLLFPGKVTLMESLMAPQFDAKQKYLAVSDTGHHRIVFASLDGKIKMTSGGPSAGFQDGSIESARFRNPQGLAFQFPSSLFVADTGNHAIRLINLEDRTVKTVAGTGLQGTDKEGGHIGLEQVLASPWDVCLSRSMTAMAEEAEPDMLVFANAGTHQIWGLALRSLTWWKNLRFEAGRCVRLAGTGSEENRNNNYPTKAAFAQPSGLCSAVLPNTTDSVFFVADSESSSIRIISFKDGSVKGLVGGDRDPTNLFCYGDKDNSNDPKGQVLLQHPLAVAWNPLDHLLYVADSYNHKIKTVDPVTKVCTTMVGDGKVGLVDGDLKDADIRFNEPGGLCVDTTDNCIYVADTNNHCIRKIDLARNTVQTLDITTESEQTQDKATSEQKFDFEVSTGFPSAGLKWDLSFRCPEGWKWSSEAPHTWEVVYPGLNKGSSVKGELRDGNAQIDLTPSVFANALPFLFIRAVLYLCGVNLGACVRKQVIVRLNLDQSSSSEPAGNDLLRSEFTL